MKRLSLNVAGERRVLRMILVRPKNRGRRAAGPGGSQFEARLRRAVIPKRFTHSSWLMRSLLTYAKAPDEARLGLMRPDRAAGRPPPDSVALRGRWRQLDVRLGCGAGLVAAGDEVEAEEAALDGAVEHDDAAAFLEAHRAGQLHVGAEDPGGPAGVLFFPVGRQALKEGGSFVVLELLTTSARRRGGLSHLVVRFGAGAVGVAHRAFGVDALAIRRVEHEHATFARHRPLQGVGGFELDVLAHAGPLGVAGGE